MDDASQLRALRKQIRQTEAEIKDIHSQILVRKSQIIKSKENAIRRSKYPERLTVIQPQRKRYAGVPQRNIDVLDKLRYEISVKEERKASLQNSNRELDDQLNEQKQEIEEKERLLSELQHKIYKSIEKKKEMISLYEMTQEKIDEGKIERQELKRLAKDSESALVSVIQRKNKPIEDRKDAKPHRDRIIELDTRIRKLRSDSAALEHEIEMAELELAKPLPITEDEEEILFAMEDPDADTLQDTVFLLSDHLKAGERKLKALERKINNTHKQNFIIENRYNVLARISRESIPVSDTITDETVDELISKLDRVTADMDECDAVANQMLQELLSRNSDTEKTIQTRLAELNIARTRFAQQKQKLRQQIRDQRDKVSQQESELVDRICEIKRRLARRS